MILSNVKLQEALDRGWVVIEPQPYPRRADVGTCPYQTTSVDLRLGDEISFFNDSQFQGQALAGGVLQPE